jgi:serine/threonine-protein kinase
MSQPADPVGTILQGTYRLERRIGQGSMGTVYEASHVRLPRRFAVKFIAPEIATRPDALARFRREAEVASRIGHPNIVEVLDVRLDAEQPYLVMELLEGEDLEQRLRAHGPLSPAEALALLVPIASALDAAHAAGVIHRDLKPSNIVLDRTADGVPRVKLVDFGISKVLASASGLTATDSILGTPYYMAPEQAESELGAISARTDVYALGAILFEVLAGRPPVEGESPLRILYQIVHGEAPSLAALRSDLPAELSAVVERALRKRPQERFASAGELSRAFAAALGASAPAEPTEEKTIPRLDMEETVARARPAAATSPRSRAWWLAVLLPLAAAGVVAGTLLVRNDRSLTQSQRSRPDAALVAAPSPDAATVATAPLPEQARDAAAAPVRDARPDLAHPAPRLADAATRQRPDRRRRPHRAAAATNQVPARLTVHTALRGTTHWARVTLDGKYLGETPIVNHVLAPGRHTLRIARPGLRSRTLKVTLRPGEQRTLRLDLEENAP